MGLQVHVNHSGRLYLSIFGERLTISWLVEFCCAVPFTGVLFRSPILRSCNSCALAVCMPLQNFAGILPCQDIFEASIASLRGVSLAMASSLFALDNYPKASTYWPKKLADSYMANVLDLFDPYVELHKTSKDFAEMDLMVCQYPASDNNIINVCCGTVSMLC